MQSIKPCRRRNFCLRLLQCVPQKLAVIEMLCEGPSRVPRCAWAGTRPEELHFHPRVPFKFSSDSRIFRIFVCKDIRERYQGDSYSRYYLFFATSSHVDPMHS